MGINAPIPREARDREVEIDPAAVAGSQALRQPISTATAA
jgi:hypothetical protein